MAPMPPASTKRVFCLIPGIKLRNEPLAVNSRYSRPARKSKLETRLADEDVTRFARFAGSTPVVVSCAGVVVSLTFPQKLIRAAPAGRVGKADFRIQTVFLLTPSKIGLPFASSSVVETNSSP